METLRSLLNFLLDAPRWFVTATYLRCENLTLECAEGSVSDEFESPQGLVLGLAGVADAFWRRSSLREGSVS
jgi:hypothetical protein